jgi:DNA-directed RNA polymerase II subunit RPB1
MKTIKNWVTYTSGVNLNDIRYINGIDLNKTICNDIMVIYETYGIDAARAALIKEFKTVFAAAGNNVNYAHLELLCDLMTSGGIPVSIDRHGMNKSETDPLARASFEKTVDQLLTAAVFGEVDHMNNVSSRIMAGLVIRGGTGLCNVILDSEFLVKSEYLEDIEQKYVKTYNEITKNAVVNDMINKEISGIFIPE